MMKAQKAVQPTIETNHTSPKADPVGASGMRL
jgi:hypothetical protein